MPDQTEQINQMLQTEVAGQGGETLQMPEVPGMSPVIPSQMPQQPDPAVLQRHMFLQQQRQHMEQMAEEKRKNEQYREVLFETYKNRLNPRQQEVANLLWSQQKERESIENELKEAREYIRGTEEALLPVVQDQVFGFMSKQHGIDKEVLRHARTPQALEDIVQALSEYKKRLSFEQRRDFGVDGVPNSSGQSSSLMGNAALLNKYRGTGKIAAYLKELSKATA